MKIEINEFESEPGGVCEKVLRGEKEGRNDIIKL